MKRQLIRTEGGGLYSARSINNKNKTVECFPSGGGFVRTIPFSKIVDFDSKPTEIYKKVVVGFEGVPVVEAFINEDTNWNGWEIPHVTLEGLRKFADNQNQHLDDTDNWGRVVIREEDKTFSFNDEEFARENWVFYGSEPIIDTDGTIHDVYNIGLGLIWEIIEEES